MEITFQLRIIISIFAFINLFAFLVMLVDKIKSKKTGAERISEGMLFFLGTIFGSLGVYTGMFVFHHKTKKWYFLLGIPLLLAENIATLAIIYLYLLKH